MSERERVSNSIRVACVVVLLSRHLTRPTSLTLHQTYPAPLCVSFDDLAIAKRHGGELRAASTSYQQVSRYFNIYTHQHLHACWRIEEVCKQFDCTDIHHRGRRRSRCRRLFAARRGRTSLPVGASYFRRALILEQ